MKNRYTVKNDLIIGLNMSLDALEYYETDENLQCQDANGAYRYKLSGGVHVLRSQSEINNDADYIVAYRKKKLEELKSLIRENWMEVNRTADEIKTKYTEVKVANLNTITKIDNAYNAALTWMGL